MAGTNSAIGTTSGVIAPQDRVVRGRDRHNATRILQCTTADVDSFIPAIGTAHPYEPGLRFSEADWTQISNTLDVELTLTYEDFDLTSTPGAPPGQEPDPDGTPADEVWIQAGSSVKPIELHQDFYRNHSGNPYVRQFGLAGQDSGTFIPDPARPSITRNTYERWDAQLREFRNDIDDDSTDTEIRQSLYGVSSSQAAAVTVGHRKYYDAKPSGSVLTRFLGKLGYPPDFYEGTQWYQWYVESGTLEKSGAYWVRTLYFVSDLSRYGWHRSIYQRFSGRP